MNILLLFLLSVLPGLFLIYRYYKKDIYKKEPWTLIWISFFIGAVTVIPAGLFESWIEVPNKESMEGMILENFLVIALTEEILKLLALYFFAYKNKNFNETMDGIVYGVAVSSGFATFENIFYVMQNGFTVGIIRAILSVPAHIFWGAILGYWLAKAKFHFVSLFKAVLIGLSIVVIGHGFFDFVLTYNNAEYFAFSLLPVIALGLLVKRYVRLALEFDLKNIHTHIELEQVENQTSVLEKKSSEAFMISLQSLISICLYFLGIIFLLTGLFLLIGFIALLQENKAETWTISFALIPILAAIFMIYKAKKRKGNKRGI
ncbi:MAG TPA: PrsW family glutamic-type intramembrane protease [Leptospiraceae bacterium]|nr:PrsW family glutamic-type intramembrane protease [Leptospiraceae bacterium]